MLVSGKDWNEYFDSWPKNVFVDSDVTRITVNGEPRSNAGPRDIADSEEVRVLSGTFISHDPSYANRDISDHLRAWLDKKRAAESAEHFSRLGAAIGATLKENGTPADPERFEGACLEAGDQGKMEADLKAWAKGIRDSFGRDRKQYNFAVCDALASAGLAPNANMLLRIGQWGNSSSVQGDMRDWFRALSERMKQIEANIPLAARRKGTELLEQLWELARHEAESLQATPLRKQLIEMIGIHGDLKLSHDELSGKYALLLEESAATDQDIELLKVNLKAVISAKATQEKLQADRVEALLIEYSALAIQKTSAYEEAVGKIRTQLDKQTEQSRAEVARALLQVDAERQLSAKWLAESLAAKEVATRLQDQLSQLRVASATHQGELVRLTDRIVYLTEQVKKRPADGKLKSAQPIKTPGAAAERRA